MRVCECVGVHVCVIMMMMTTMVCVWARVCGHVCVCYDDDGGGGDG